MFQEFARKMGVGMSIVGVLIGVGFLGTADADAAMARGMSLLVFGLLLAIWADVKDLKEVR